MFNKKLRKEIEELERRLQILLPKECRKNNHSFFIFEEKRCSAHSQPSIEVWRERILECEFCGKRIIDSNRMGYFEYEKCTLQNDKI